MRLMQPAVEQCLNRAVYVKDTDTTRLLREIDATAEKAVTAACGDAAVARVLLLTVTGLVQSVRCRRLSLFEAEEDLKKACSLLQRGRRQAGVTGLDQQARQYGLIAVIWLTNAAEKRFTTVVRFRGHNGRDALFTIAGPERLHASNSGASPADPPPLGRQPTPRQTILSILCLSFHEPCAHGEPQETTTCPLKRSFPPIPLPPLSQ